MVGAAPQFGQGIAEVSRHGTQALARQTRKEALHDLMRTDDVQGKRLLSRAIGMELLQERFLIAAKMDHRGTESGTAQVGNLPGGLRKSVPHLLNGGGPPQIFERYPRDLQHMRREGGPAGDAEESGSSLPRDLRGRWVFGGPGGEPAQFQQMP